MASIHLLLEFSSCFISFFEKSLKKSKKYLDNDPVNVETSTLANIFAKGAYAVPVGGNLVSAAITASDQYRQKSSEENKAKRMFEIINFFEHHTDEFRTILIKGAFEVFYAYEHQFGSVSCNGGPLRAMQKLGADASDRLISFIEINENIDRLTAEIVAEGICLGESKRHPVKLLVRGKKLFLIQGKQQIRTEDFFVNVGIRIKDGDTTTYYRNKNTKRQLGHREIFSWENKQYIKSTYEVDCPEFSSKHGIDLKNKDEYVEAMYKFVTTRDPFGAMKEFVRGSAEDLETCIVEFKLENRNLIAKSEELFVTHFKDTVIQMQHENEKCFVKQNDLVKKYCVLWVHTLDDNPNLPSSCAA